MSKTMNAHNLSIAALATKEPNRFALAAVHIMPDYTEVTDGHCLVRVAKPDLTTDSFPLLPELTPNDEPALLGIDESLAIARALPKKSVIPILATAALVQNGAGRYVVATDLETVTKKPVQDGAAQYPDIDRVMPRAEGAAYVISFDVHLLARVFTQLSRMSGEKTRINSVTMRFRTPKVSKGGTVSLDGVRMDMLSAEGQAVTTVVMPTRSTEADAFWIGKKAGKNVKAPEIETVGEPEIETVAEVVG